MLLLEALQTVDCLGCKERAFSLEESERPEKATSPHFHNYASWTATAFLIAPKISFSTLGFSFKNWREPSMPCPSFCSPKLYQLPALFTTPKFTPVLTKSANLEIPSL